jgi:hypothetical protein
MNLTLMGIIDLARWIFVFVVLGLKLRGFTLSHSTSPIFVKGFLRQGLSNCFPGLALNRDPPHHSLLSS